MKRIAFIRALLCISSRIPMTVAWSPSFPNVHFATAKLGTRTASTSISTCISASSTTQLFSATSAPASSESKTTNTTIQQQQQQQPQQQPQKAWFPLRIQEDVPYKKIVQSAYLRHIVVETKEMAQLAMQAYLQCTDEDPFAAVAYNISACPLTKEEGGKIGWIDVQKQFMEEEQQQQQQQQRLLDATTTTTTVGESSSSSSIVPNDVLQQLWEKQPKSGDMYIFSSSITNQVHLLKVEELLLNHLVQFQNGHDENKALRVGSHNGQNALIARSKLKGKGITAKMPSNPKTYLIHTAGCQMNAADTERMAGILQNQLHMTPAHNNKDPDLVIFNTCSIRDHAEQKLYDALGPYAAHKRSGRKEIALIVTGCVAQQEGEALLRRVPEVDVVLGPQYVPHLKNVLESVQWGNQIVATSPMIQQDRDMAKPIRDHQVKAWVNVIYGCNEHCTYCVVPAVRGMEQSRPMEAILEECRGLAENGYKEITLLGQNIDAYGRDMVPKRNFADLLKYLNANLPDPMRVRYVTSHPRYFSDTVIDAVATLDKVCEGFHMPFQAGDDEVLRKMRRGYTFESYMRIIHKIRAKAPDAAIYGDVIVGFPGESDEAFERTLELMRQVKFDNLNTFAYSPRPNTEAALWEDQVPEDVKSQRLQRVQKLAAEHGLERSSRYVGRVEEVLVEDRNPRNPEQVMGRTRQGRQVYFDGDIDELQGKFMKVKVVEARTWSLMGERV